MRFFVGITDGDWFDFLSRMDFVLESVIDSLRRRLE